MLGLVREELTLVVFKNTVAWRPDIALSCLDLVLSPWGVARGAVCTGPMNMGLSVDTDFSGSLHQCFSLQVVCHFSEVTTHTFTTYFLSTSLYARPLLPSGAIEVNKTQRRICMCVTGILEAGDRQ